jgi:hypothetical protein
MSRGTGINKRKIRAQNYELETVTQKCGIFATLSMFVQPYRPDTGMSRGLHGREKCDT